MYKTRRKLGEFINRSLIIFEYEKSPLDTIVYGGTGTGRLILLDNT